MKNYEEDKTFKVTLEIKVKKDIQDKYRNFNINYTDQFDFIRNLVSSMEHNITLNDCEVFKNLHPEFDNSDFEYPDDGYQVKVKSFEEITPKKLKLDFNDLVNNYIFRIIVKRNIEFNRFMELCNHEDFTKHELNDEDFIENKIDTWKEQDLI